MCTDFHHDSIDEIAEEGFLFEERIQFIQGMITSCDRWYLLKDQLHALQEAYNRNCYDSDPHFPGEE